MQPSAKSLDMSQVQNVKPATFMRVIGFALLVGAIAIYARQHYGWWIFALLLLAPDLSALGYLINVRAGNLSYNMVHFLFLPLALLAASLVLGQEQGIQIALIWIAHIGMDRAAGYGLKRLGTSPRVEPASSD